MTPDDLDASLAPHGLFVMGRTPDGNSHLILIGAGPDMWPLFTNSPEFEDNAADPLDRWSKRIIGQLCAPHGWQSIYPSDGPPYAPFIAWAKQSGRFWNSPTGMLLHDRAGLMISIRGAIRVPEPLDAPAPHESPCDRCIDKPCRTTCPVSALSDAHDYDVPRCKAFLDTGPGLDCMDNGCKVRRACPISQAFGRDPAQSAFHMKSFHPT